MPKYQPVVSHIWKDDCFPELSKDGKLLFLYLITNESINNSGLYQVTVKTISQETGIPSKTVLELLANGSIKNVSYDQENSYVFVHNRRRYSPGGNPEKVKIGIQKEFELSKCTFLWKLFDKLYPAILKDLTNCSGTVPKGFENPSIPLPLPLPLAIPLAKDLNNNKPLKIEKKVIEERSLEYLNGLIGTKFRPVSTTLGFFSARLKDGATEQDIRDAISHCVNAWGCDPERIQYINPETICRPTKFEKYRAHGEALRNKPTGTGKKISITGAEFDPLTETDPALLENNKYD